MERREERSADSRPPPFIFPPRRNFIRRPRGSPADPDRSLHRAHLAHLRHSPPPPASPRSRSPRLSPTPLGPSLPPSLLRPLPPYITPWSPGRPAPRHPPRPLPLRRRPMDRPSSIFDSLFFQVSPVRAEDAHRIGVADQPSMMLCSILSLTGLATYLSPAAPVCYVPGRDAHPFGALGRPVAAATATAHPPRTAVVVHACTHSMHARAQSLPSQLSHPLLSSSQHPSIARTAPSPSQLYLPGPARAHPRARPHHDPRTFRDDTAPEAHAAARSTNSTHRPPPPSSTLSAPFYLSVIFLSTIF
ncbi:hypothetical protein HETIRDRAFT_102141 [Heterobasidion irregulare TC 32-1]|uniref:Uncharacterized protein n=1 Tax=Heterobasidion irregulare (strain TC 32-1) TaxID=747525 RepID=W4K5I8_HETIT|nr:uncharacterized protein HETIRDRAFT_102141 [Heterobasidion irregulare TC 32-1]ETW81093.1 hypothetical protein HETIRDRAFT_102141 [Heterobasidion irregulare TC 32-1]